MSEPVRAIAIGGRRRVGPLCAALATLVLLTSCSTSVGPRGRQTRCVFGCADFPEREVETSTTSQRMAANRTLLAAGTAPATARTSSAYPIRR